MARTGGSLVFALDVGAKIECATRLFSGDEAVRNRIARLLAVLATVIVVAGNAPETLAQTDDARWTLEGDAETGTTLRGYRPQASYRFTVPAGVAGQGPLTLSLATETTRLIGDDATLAIEVNGRPIDTLALATDRSQHSISIDPGFLEPGQNVIRLRANLSLNTDSACIDPANPARWLVVSDSILTGVFAPTGDLTISDFPEALVPLGHEATSIAAVLPEDFGADALNALAAIAFGVARSEPTATWEITVADADAATIGLDGPALIVGDAELDTARGEGRARLRRDSSGWPVLAIAAPPDGSLTAVADALVDPAAEAPTSSDTLDVITAPLRSPQEAMSSFTLGDIGYRQRDVAGFGPQSLIYNFDMPFEWQPSVGSIDTELAAGPGELSLALNGRDIGAIPLDAEDGQQDLPALALPASVLRPGRNFLRLTFDLDPSPTCVPISSGPSASVPASTQIELPHQAAGGRIDLNDFPFLFMAEPDMATLTIALPDEPTVGEIAAGVRLVQAFGSSSSRFAPRMIASEDVTDAVRQGHLIVIGRAARQPLLKELLPSLPLELEADGQPARLTEFEVDGEAAGPGTAQIFASPWAANRVIMTVTGPTEPSFRAALDAVLGEPASEIVTGPAILAGDRDSSGVLHITVMRAQIPPLDAPSEGFIERVPLPFRIVFFVVVAVVIAAASTLFRRGSPEQDPASSGHH